MNEDLVMALIQAEYYRAVRDHGPLRSPHEGYGVLLEEVDELWEAVRLKPSNPERKEAMRREAVHVAAMALQFLMDCCEREEE